MTEEAKRIAEKLDRITISRSDLDRVCKDRLDFGFDSIYFRYAELCDELAMYKSIVEHKSPVELAKFYGGRKMHFYNTLEQLLHAHEEEDNGIN